MNTLLTSIIQANIVFTFLFSMYKMFFAGDSCFNSRRAYLFVLPFVSVLLPALQWLELPIAVDIITLPEVVTQVFVLDVVSTSAKTIEQPLFASITRNILLSVSFVLFCILLKGIYTILMAIKGGKRKVITAII